MNNFRHPHPKPFGARGPELPNPWMTEEEMASMRRQNPQFYSPIQNMPPSMHSPLLNQSSLLTAPNKSFVNQNSCKMLNSNFTRSPNMDIFKSSPMNELNYPNRFVGNRIPNNSYSHMNMQQKMNEGSSFKDFGPSNMMPSQSNKSDVFSESISKPLFSNVRQPQERFSCMQNDQVQFHSKYDNSRVYQEKGFPFSNDKDFQAQSHAPFNDHLSVGSNFPSYKSNYRAPSLFPAYTPKDMQDENTKSVQPSSYSSNFIGKSNTFCDKTSLPSTFVGKTDNFCDKSPVCSTTFSKTVESFQGKADIFQDKAEPFQERNVSERVVNDLFPPNSTAPSFMYDKQPLKSVPNSQVSHDSFKALDDPETSSSSKYSYPPENQQSCYQSSNEIPIQRSQNIQMPNYPSSTSTKDCLMQSVPFSSQSNVQQNVKENFSSFNFESNISTTDIADLLPGLDAFLKEHLEKPEEIAPKHEVSKSSASNCAFSDDEWSKHSIPFIGENKAADNNILNDNKDPLYDQSTCMKEKCSDKFELKSEKATELPLPDIKQSNNYSTVGENLPKTTVLEKEPLKVRSVLEEAIELLVTNDAIVGLDYITEYKKNIGHEGSFPFRCKLCNSAISRPSIIDHILGSKHRMRYLKTKDESKYEYIISLKIEKSEKEAKISEAAFEMEKIYGRGYVTVDTVEYQKDTSAENSSKEIDDGTVAPVFTLDKIPIGFEALSPQHEGMNTEFSLEPNLNQTDQDIDIKKETANGLKSTDEKKDATCDKSSSSSFTMPCLESDSSVPNLKPDLKSISPHLNFNSVVQKKCKMSEESDTKVQLQYADSGLCGPAKRALPFEDSSCPKLQKTDSVEETKPCTDVLLDPKKTEIHKEDYLSDKKEFNIHILENLSKSSISSEEEASVVLQAINVLMKLLLRYKLQHLSLEKVENLMKSLQSKSPENIEDLSSLLKESHKVESKNIEASTSLISYTTDNVHLKPSIPVEDNSARHVKQELSSHTGSSNTDVNELELPVKNASNSCTSDLALSTKTLPAPDIRVNNNASISVPQTSGMGTLDNATEAAKKVADTSCMSQASSSVGLKPPPFFGWQPSEAVMNQVTYAAVQGSQNMIWTSPYQHTQAQYSQMPYYQPQNYGNTFGGTQVYQSQFSVLPRSSLPGEIAQPPLPPPPPPPPPAPSNPPLPPLPSSSLYPSSGSSHSVPLPSNASACLPVFPTQSSHLPPRFP